MAWMLQTTFPLAAAPDERFQLVPVLLEADAIGYGFRVINGLALPDTWQRQGWWMWVQGAGGRYFHSEVHPLPILSVGNAPPITLIGANQSDTLGVTPSEFAVAISLSRWVPRESVEVWYLLP